MILDPTAPTTSNTHAKACVLCARSVTKSYGDRQVLAGVSLEVGAGERLALTGPSGSGKSTLLNCLGGVDRHDSGSIELLGQRLESLDNTSLAQLRRRHVGTVFQFFQLLPTLSAAENVELPLQLIGAPAPARADRVKALLERVGLLEHANALPARLSGGEMQRVAIARALAHEPRLLLADEPTGNLDTANGRIVLELLRTLTDEQGVALVLVTHSEEAAAICHRTIHLRDGRIV